MLDWRKITERELRRLSVPAHRRSEIAAELAGYLEDRFSALCRQGIEPEAAMRDCVQEIGSWPALRRALERASQEGTMADRLRNFWLPGAFAAIATLAMPFYLAQYEPVLGPFRLGSGRDVFFLYVPWLIATPIVGAIAACLSRRAGAPRSMRVVAVLFPVWVMALVFAVSAPIKVSQGFRWIGLSNLLVDSRVYQSTMIIKADANRVRVCSSCAVIPAEVIGTVRAIRTFELVRYLPDAEIRTLAIVSFLGFPALGLMLGAWPFLHERTSPAHPKSA